MKQKTTFSLWKRLLLVLVLLVPLVHSFGQNNRVYATSYSNAKNVTDPAHAVDKDLNTRAKLEADAGVLIGLFGKTGELELSFGTTNVAKKTVFTKIQVDDENLLDALLGGSLGGLLSGVVDNLILGKHNFEVELFNGANSKPFLKGSSHDGFRGTNFKLIKDSEGQNLLAINAVEGFNRIRFKNTDKAVAGLLVGPKNFYIYDAYYEDDSSVCGKPMGTSYDVDGQLLELKLLNFKDQNLHHAIDGDLSSYSTLSPGSLLDVSVGGAMSQMFYFPTSSDEKASVNIKLDFGGKGVLDLDLLGGLEILAYDGEVEVYRNSLSGGLISDLNLLELIKKGEKVDITVAPGRKFDRIEVKSSSLVGLGLISESVRIYDVERFDGVTCKNPLINEPTPSDQPFDKASCSTTLGVFENVNFAHNAVDGNNESFSILTANAGTLLVSTPQVGKLEMKHSAPVEANKTTYIRIDTDKEVLDALLGGTLGKLIDGIGGLVLGKHVISVEAFDVNGQSIKEASSSNGFDGTNNNFIRLVQDNIGRYYLAVTPDRAYKNIVVSNSVSGLPLGESRFLKVYDMCTEVGTDICFPGQFTSYSGTGINLGVGEIGDPGVKNPYHAISSNSSNYSEINPGLLGVGTVVSQSVFFNHPSEANSTLNVRAFLNPGSVLDLELLARYSVVTSLNGVEQETFMLKQGILNNLDVLGLFKKGIPHTFTFDATKVYDKVDIRVGVVVAVGTTPALRVYNINRESTKCPLPKTESPFSMPACAGNLVGFDAQYTLNAMNAINGDFDSFATLTSDSGIVIGSNKFSGFIELGYDYVIPAGVTSYVRFDFDESVLQGLLGGSLGNVLSGLVDGLLLGSHYFDVDVKDEKGEVILQGSSKGNDVSFKNNGNIRIVSDKAGRTYIAITPTVPYKSVRISDHTEAIVGITGKPGSMNVYGMCYEANADTCLDSFATSYEFKGLALTVNDLSGAGVQYPERAIDDNSTNYSIISSGTLAVAGSVKQFIYFNSLSKADDVVNVKFRTQGGAVNADLLGAIEIIAYNGEDVVATLPITSGLINGINVANLLSNNQVVDLPFAPGVPYNRISVGKKSLLGVTVAGNIHLYDVTRNCDGKGLYSQLVSWKSYEVDGDATVKVVSGDEEVDYTIHVRNEGTLAIPEFTVSDKLPAGVTLVGIPANAVVNGNELTYSYVGSLAPGEEVSYTFKVKVASTADLKGISEIKNIAYTLIEGEAVPNPSYPPVENTNPTDPDVTKQPGTIILVTQCVSSNKAIIEADIDSGILCEGGLIVLTSKEGADEYQWFLNGNKLNNQGDINGADYGKSFVTNLPGSYTLMTRVGECWSLESDAFVVDVTPLPIINVEGELEFAVKLDSEVTYPTITSPDGPITWYDNSGEIAELPKKFTAAGVYTFTGVVNNGGCASTVTVIVTVYDLTGCAPMTTRVYAQEAKGWETKWYTTLFGGVSNTGNAVDANPTTHSTITLGVSLLGLGTTWQNIYFGGDEIPAGTPVSVKLGQEYSLLAVGDGISIVGLDKNGKDIGPVKSVGGGLLKLLSADNVYEYTFVPSSKNGPQAYYGVRVIYGAAVGVGASMKIYDVYYTAPGNACEANPLPDEGLKIPTGINQSVLDIHHGIQDIGLGVATSLSPFVNPWHAVDNDEDTYAYINRSVAVINAATLTVLFKQQAMQGDELHIDIEDTTNPLLSLDLLKGFSIQRYLGDKKVGPQIDAGGQVLGLTLLGLGKGERKRLIVSPFDAPYDRVKITYANLVSVFGSDTRIYDVSISPKIFDGGIDLDKYYDVCYGGVFTIDNDDFCTEYKVYADKEKKTEIPSINGDGKNFDLSKILNHGKQSIFIQAIRNGCEIGRMQEIKVNLTDCAIKSNLNVTTKINY